MLASPEMASSTSARQSAIRRPGCNAARPASGGRCLGGAANVLVPLSRHPRSGQGSAARYKGGRCSLGGISSVILVYLHTQHEIREYHWRRRQRRLQRWSVVLSGELLAILLLESVLLGK